MTYRPNSGKMIRASQNERARGRRERAAQRQYAYDQLTTSEKIALEEMRASKVSAENWHRQRRAERLWASRGTARV